jgi:lipopolysaccharide cholinephosphotransferase
MTRLDVPGMREVSMDEARPMLLATLCAFRDICDRHSLRYYLSGGTLLGAIRHGGFIPWDDDIDVIMPRPDYDRLIELSREEPFGRYALLASETNGAHIYPFAKFCDSKTVLIEDRHSNAEGMGVFIDIFPMDGVSDDMVEYKRQLRKISFWNRLGKYAGTSVWTSKNPLLVAPRFLVVVACKAIGCKAINRRVSWLAKVRPFSESRCVAVVVWGYGTRERIEREAFEPRRVAKFEGDEFSISEGFDAYLRNLYGDYMSLPPVESRVRKHDFSVYVRD